MPKPRAPKKKPMESVLEINIVYRVEAQDFNGHELLDRLREYGAAEITSIKVVPGPI